MNGVGGGAWQRVPCPSLPLCSLSLSRHADCADQLSLVISREPRNIRRPPTQLFPIGPSTPSLVLTAIIVTPTTHPPTIDCRRVASDQLASSSFAWFVRPAYPHRLHTSSPLPSSLSPRDKPPRSSRNPSTLNHSRGGNNREMSRASRLWTARDPRVHRAQLAASS